MSYNSNGFCAGRRKRFWAQIPHAATSRKEGVEKCTIAHYACIFAQRRTTHSRSDNLRQKNAGHRKKLHGGKRKGTHKYSEIGTSPAQLRDQLRTIHPSPRAALVAEAHACTLPAIALRPPNSARYLWQPRAAASAAALLIVQRRDASPPHARDGGEALVTIAAKEGGAQLVDCRDRWLLRRRSVASIELREELLAVRRCGEGERR
eukprot:6188503-Pleurochrysis_carterae.AAC.7